MKIENNPRKMLNFATVFHQFYLYQNKSQKEIILIDWPDLYAS